MSPGSSCVVWVVFLRADGNRWKGQVSGVFDPEPDPNEPTDDQIESDMEMRAQHQQTVPRVATSVDDLKPGQSVAWIEPSTGEWWVCQSYDPAEGWDWTGTELILQDPPPPSDFRVPAAEILRLDSAMESVSLDFDRYHPDAAAVFTAARAVLDAAEEVTK